MLRDFSTSEIGHVFACGSPTRSPMLEQMVQADLRH
jgi:hypothetical protein